MWFLGSVLILRLKIIISLITIVDLLWCFSCIATVTTLFAFFFLSILKAYLHVALVSLSCFNYSRVSGEPKLSIHVTEWTHCKLYERGQKLPVDSNGRSSWSNVLHSWILKCQHDAYGICGTVFSFFLKFWFSSRYDTDGDRGHKPWLDGLWSTWT